jgi:anaerobic glycerol-3-phosphate dehydrogenase
LVSASSVCADNFNKFKQYLLQHNATLAFASGTLSFLSSSPSFSTSVSSLSSGHSPITQLAAALKIVFQSVSGCLTLTY